jgi:chemotaxis protein CheZ
MSKNWSEELFVNLKQLQDKNGGVIDMNNIDHIIKQFLEVLDSYLVTDQEHKIYSQVEKILVQMDTLKKEVSNLSEEVLDKNFIPNITTDLGSVISQTEKSVMSILDLSGEIADISKKIPNLEIREELTSKSIKIIELCHFQDLTGQRIKRIADHLNGMESIIYKMLHVLRPEESLRNKFNDPLLNGPQKDHETPSQKDIDTLFNK